MLSSHIHTHTDTHTHNGIFAAPALGMARYMDPVFRPFVRPSVNSVTTLALTLMSWSVTLKPFEILWQNLVQR